MADEVRRTDQPSHGSARVERDEAVDPADGLVDDDGLGVSTHPDRILQTTEDVSVAEVDDLPSVRLPDVLRDDSQITGGGLSGVDQRMSL